MTDFRGALVHVEVHGMMYEVHADDFGVCVLITWTRKMTDVFPPKPQCAPFEVKNATITVFYIVKESVVKRLRSGLGDIKSAHTHTHRSGWGNDYAVYTLTHLNRRSCWGESYRRFSSQGETHKYRPGTHSRGNRSTHTQTHTHRPTK